MAADWIDKLEEQQAKEGEQTSDTRKLQIQRADFIKATMPAFWNDLKTQIQTDIRRLRETFPRRPQYHCTLENVQQGKAFRLINTIPPRVNLIVAYNESGQRIEISSDDDHQGRRQEYLRIDATPVPDLIIFYGDKSITSPTKLSEMLVKRVARIP